MLCTIEKPTPLVFPEGQALATANTLGGGILAFALTLILVLLLKYAEIQLNPVLLGELGRVPGFKASKGWFCNFCAKHGVGWQESVGGKQSPCYFESRDWQVK